MKTFKIVDLLIQISLPVLLVTFPAYRLTPFYNNYYIIGGWQLISFIVHAIINYQSELPGLRKIYQFLIIAGLAITFLSLLVPGLGFIWLMLLIFFAPILAVFYIVVCFLEIL